MVKVSVTVVGRFGFSLEILTKRIKELPRFSSEAGSLDVVIPGLLALTAWWKK